MCRMSLIYAGFRAKEIAAIRDVAKKLGVIDEQVDQLRSLHEEEKVSVDSLSWRFRWYAECIR